MSVFNQLNDIEYDTSEILIEYKDNMEYRKIIRKLFKINSYELLEKIKNDYTTNDGTIIDEVTMDEMTYDSDKIMDTMDLLFNLTKNNKLFGSMYTLAAGKILSTDKLIGQSILFSYDYLYLYHACLCTFILSPSNFTETCEYYVQLKNKLEKK